MSAGRHIRDDLGPGAPEELIRLADRLERARPVPAAAFRGDLRRRLLAGAVPRTRPARLRVLIGSYAGAGSLLMLIAGAGASGLGPLAG